MGVDNHIMSLMRQRLISLKLKAIQNGVNFQEMQTVLKTHVAKWNKEGKPKTPRRIFLIINSSFISYFCIIIIAVAVLFEDLSANRCIVENNYIVMEMTRPETNCNICKNVHGVIHLENVTKAIFSKFAYLGRPMLVRGATGNWTALKTFNFFFFKHLFSEIDGAYKSVEEECQFFPFQTDFLSLRDVFSMPLERANMSSLGERSWYIGWSNCNPDVSKILRHHYSRPHFLPDDSESSAIDWIFMGYSGQGASLHLDYVQRPSWQAQISGTKTWYLLPPPECETVCHSMNITVYKGDIILVDTNQWYHTTFIHPEEISITIGSEYD